MKYIWFLILFPTLSFAQLDHVREPIATDRPDQTETPSLVPKGMLQVETGFSYEKTTKHADQITTPSVLWKYGVNENFELRLITTLATINDSVTIAGLEPIMIGLKIKLSDEEGIFPQTSFIGHLALPSLASSDLQINHYAPSFRLSMQHTLNDRLSLGYNVGAEWDGSMPDATFLYTLTTAYELTNKFGSYIELYGFAPENAPAYHSVDGGITFLISNDMMIDLSGGIGITANAPRYFVAAGFSFRI